MSTSRPVPQRSLPNPTRLKVAQRDTGGFIGPSTRSDVQALKSDLDHRAEVKRKADKWADRLMETTPSLGVFKKAVSYLTPTQYVEVTHERHLSNRCSYPPCDNTPKRPFDPKKKIKISWTSRTIADCEGNPEDGFCGRGCRVKSNWVVDRLGELSVWERASEAVRLLEEEGEGVQQDLLVPSGAGSSRDGGRIKPPPVGKPISVSRPQEKPVLARPPIPIADRDLNVDLMGALSIVEHPTPAAQPPAPSDPPPVQPKPPTPMATPTRREAGSLVKTPQELSHTFLNASRSMGPVPQLPPDSDEEGDDHYRIQEEEMGLTWGTEDDEVRRLFAVAQVARDMEEE